MNYDILIVGAGMYGSVMAERLTKIGKRVLVIDKRSHIGGNCYSHNEDGIEVHDYGPHVFHTSSSSEWEYVNQFGHFRQFDQRTFAIHNDKAYSLPINLKTIDDFFGVNFTPGQAHAFIESKRVKIDNPQNAEEYALTRIGEELYYAFIYGYTKKMWGREPNELPVSILQRLPIRFTFEDGYHFDRFSGIPYNGWGEWFKRLLAGIDYKTGIDYMKDRDRLNEMADVVIFTGPIDHYYSFCFGPLQYRSLDFEMTKHDCEYYQGCAVMNFPDLADEHTRIVEYKHFFPGGAPAHTITVTETPRYNPAEPYYPVRSKQDIERLKLYREKAQEETKVFFGGRLGEYRYYDMNQVIKKAMEDYKKFI
jgi:UDP-galactopyranose mutase